MADNISLNVEVRNEIGKGASRALRRNNLVPGIIYGGDQKPQAIKIKFNELFRLLKKGQQALEIVKEVTLKDILTAKFIVSVKNDVTYMELSHQKFG